MEGKIPGEIIINNTIRINSLYYTFGLLPKISAPLLTILLARFFSPELFGMFISLQMMVLTLSKFFVLGLDRGMLWWVGQNLKAGREAFSGLREGLRVSTLFSIAGFLALALFCFAGGLSHLGELNNANPVFVVICLASLVPMGTMAIVGSALEGKQMPQYRLFWHQFFIMSLGPLMALIWQELSQNENILAWSFTLSNIFGAVLFLKFAKTKAEAKPEKVGFRIPKELFTYSLPLLFADVISSLLLRVDVWMILGILGPRMAGVYAIMVTLSNGIKTIRQSYDSMIIPLVSKMEGGSLKSQLRPVFSYAVNMVTSLQMLIALAVFFFSTEILLMAGKDYAVHTIALTILVVGNLLNGFFGLNGQIVLALGKSKFSLATHVAALVLNLVLNALFIPKFGIAGAALASVLSMVSQNLFYFIMVYRWTKTRVYERFLILNGILIALYCLSIAVFFQTLSSWALSYRVGLALAMLTVLGIFYFLNRHSYRAPSGSNG